MRDYEHVSTAVLLDMLVLFASLRKRGGGDPVAVAMREQIQIIQREILKRASLFRPHANRRRDELRGPTP